MGVNVWGGVIRRDKMMLDVTTFWGDCIQNVKLSLTLALYQKLGIKCGQVW